MGVTLILMASHALKNAVWFPCTGNHIALAGFLLDLFPAFSGGTTAHLIDWAAVFVQNMAQV